MKNFFAISTETASLSPFYLALDSKLNETDGKYFYKLKERKSCKESYNINLADKIWAKSIEYIE